jgi:hypothetical protein
MWVPKILKVSYAFIRKYFWSRPTEAPFTLSLQSPTDKMYYNPSVFCVKRDFFHQSKRLHHSSSFLLPRIFNRDTNSSHYSNTSLGTALFWVITQRVVVISYQPFGTAYRSHIQLLRFQKSRTIPAYRTRTPMRRRLKAGKHHYLKKQQSEHLHKAY